MSRGPAPSPTAALMAVQRGLESCRPSSSRLFSDPYARRFASRGWKLALLTARVGFVRRTIEAVYDRAGGPGPRPSAIARTRLIDDIVENLAPAVDQVVVLGAGYDTRPYRLRCLRHSSVFEVDHPGTQVVKAARLSKLNRPHAERLSLVPVDFELDDLAQSLQGAGFCADSPSLFVWEGVTQYLSPDAVDATLRVVGSLGAPGSVLVLTYVDGAVIDGDRRMFPEAAKWLRGVERRGEPWRFGIAPESLPGFLRARGFALLEDVSLAEAGARYFGPLGRPERGSALYRVATASVVRDGAAPGDEAGVRTWRSPLPASGEPRLAPAVPGPEREVGDRPAEQG